jgi:nucleoid-associated protein YgaU
VKLGDSLSSIAERFYGNGALWSSLVKANPQLKGREDFLEIGEALIIPNREEAARGAF